MKKAVILPLLLLIFADCAFASGYATVKEVRFKSYQNYTRVIVEVDGVIEFTQNRLSGPDRFFFDLKNCILPKKRSLPVEDGVLKAVRTAQFDAHTVRVVLDLKKSEGFSAFMMENPHRLVVDVYAGKNAPTPPVEEKKAGETAREIRTIVIDPGHGGEDPGAIGPGGTMEKDIVLHVGKKLGGILSEKYGAEVIYTRDRDVFIPLNERTETANAKKADLFISIHANASNSKNARGIETYFLNWTDNEEAQKVAARENRVSFKKMEKMQGDLQMILHDLARKNKNEESMKLAHSVQNSMVNALKTDYSGIEDLGVKYALFYVLVGAEMPSVLVEISFISNNEEEKRLTEDGYRDKIAKAIADGINSYISESTLLVKRAAGSI